MSDMQCCRTCLVTDDLNPIFHEPSKCDIYSKILLLTTGLKINLNDSLPQQICTKCVNIINNHTQFLEQCFISEKALLEKTNNIKTEVNDEIQMKLDLETEHNEYEEEDQTKEVKNTTDDVVNFESTVAEVLMKHKDIGFISQTNRIETHMEPECSKSYEVSTFVKRRKVKLEYPEEDVVVKKKIVSQKEPFECKYCKKIYTTKNILYHHYKTHLGGNIVCEHCGKRFVTNRKLLIHCKAKHGYEKTDKCSYCDYRAASKDGLKVHERLHTGERPFACGECDARFHRKSSYLQHVAIHLPEKTVQCDECPARFKSVTLMKIHKQRHRVRYRCGLCGNTFARRLNVTRHLVNVHNMSPDPKHILRIKM